MTYMMNNLTDAQKEAVQEFIREYLAYLDATDYDSWYRDTAQEAIMDFIETLKGES